MSKPTKKVKQPKVKSPKVSTRPDVPNPYIDDIVRKHLGKVKDD